MNSFEKGTWIVNSAKHIVNLKTSTSELSFFEATEQAGKAGLLLARLVSPAQEIIPAQKVKIFARESGITAGELTNCLSNLKSAGKIDFTVSDGKPRDVEVYCFSSKDAIETVPTIFDAQDPTQIENASLSALSDTFHAPRYLPELVQGIVSNGFDEKTAAQTVQLQETLRLVKSAKAGSETLLYNEYAFAGAPEKIANALKALSPSERQAVEDIQQYLEKYPGVPYESLTKYSKNILEMMEGVGLIDVVPVYSPYGKASFVTLPQHKGISIGASPVSSDVFHKVKLMLSCLRYGEIKSGYGRGKIKSAQMLQNIVNKLNRLDWVGPCTAIGQDYQLLEKDGVIETRPASSGMFYMKLRQPEIGVLVKQIIEFNTIVGDIDSQSLKILGTQPSGYDLPETRRSDILAQPSPGVSSIRSKLMHSLRTGATLK